MSQLSTRFTRALDLDVPLVQAPIGGGATPRLVAAVADAGALGMLPVTWKDPERTRDLITEVRDRTDGRFAANIVIDPDAKDVPTEAALDAAIDAGVDVVSFSFGDAAPYVDRVHDADGIVLQTVGTADEAARAVSAGVDVVVSQGWEAGGHVQSEVATMPLVPRVRDAAGDVPVVAAGGIADGRGIAAAFALGADGAWLGTRFLTAREATIHPEYREHVLRADEADTEFTEAFDVGWPDVPHRVIRNSTLDRWEAAGRPPHGERPGEDEPVGEFADGSPVPRYDYRSPSEGVRGDVEAMALYAGQSTGLTNDEPTVQAVIDRLVAETKDALDRLPDPG